MVKPGDIVCPIGVGLLSICRVNSLGISISEMFPNTNVIFQFILYLWGKLDPKYPLVKFIFMSPNYASGPELYRKVFNVNY